MPVQINARWSQISLLFDERVELDADHRSARLAWIATGNAAIAEQVRSCWLLKKEIAACPTAMRCPPCLEC